MSAPCSPGDVDERRRALDPERSCIVQAPAGSGKTELLTQRFLALLARVEHPEEIVAITFTRKAAAGMRDRILNALADAAAGAPAASEHAQLTRGLAEQVLAQDARHDWQLALNPGRLRVQTIDSLCQQLARQLPITAGLGGLPQTVEDASDLYREAARLTLDELEAGGHWSDAIERLLVHLDNDLARVEGLLVDMLRRRDQWLPAVLSGARRQRLEQGLAHLISDALEAARRALPLPAVEELLALARHAVLNLRGAGAQSPLCHLPAGGTLPGVTPADAPAWSAIAALLLTREGRWRTRVDRRHGFPAEKDYPGSAVVRDRFANLVASLREAPECAERLAELRSLPPPVYSDAQWTLLEALLDLLRLAAAQLQVVFATRASIDFVGVARAAIEALGPEDAPSDLGLALDHRIRHLLVDEFQDTSSVQYELLRRLTAGWEPGDARTLFVVGDPMQSIYRFRQAEVGLFLATRHAGRLADVRVEALRLSVNFRSQAGLLDWVNGVFPGVFPREDIGRGAVAYAPCAAFHASLPGPAVELHPLLAADWTAEARTVASLVARLQEERPEAGIAILVRSRDHARWIAPQLRHRGVSFRAVDMDALVNRPVVSDLSALARALSHLADRVAWLALLRTPWCGLTLADLHALGGTESDSTVWELMHDAGVLRALSVDGAGRLARTRAVLDEALAERGRRSLRRLVEGAWLALGGPACARDPAELADAEAFLDLIEDFDAGGLLLDLQGLEQRLGDLYAAPQAPGALVEIMTIHRAKGLEFDTVILPGLGRRTRGEEASLLAWIPHPRSSGDHDRLLAPVAEAGSDDPIYAYLRELHRRQAAFEEARLLYVAATRARSRLHLVGSARVRAGNVQADSRSLLALLWPAVAEVFERAHLVREPPEGPVSTDTAGPPVLERLVSGWRLPEAPPAVEMAVGAAAQSGLVPVEYVWVGATARQIGTVVHRNLARIGMEGLQAWDAELVASRRASFRAQLRARGVPADELDAAARRVEQALRNVLASERGRWVLDGTHAEARCELPVSGTCAGELISVVLDRTFVDANGVRWVIDYKLSMHEGGGSDAFLDTERARYAEQLERYAALMRNLDPRPVRVGLYFPLLDGWREWEPA